METESIKELNRKFLKSNSNTKTFKEEFEIPILLFVNYINELINCIIIDNNNNPYIIQRYNNKGVCNVKQLFDMQEIDYKIVQEAKNKVLKLGIYLYYLNYN